MNATMPCNKRCQLGISSSADSTPSSVVLTAPDILGKTPTGESGCVCESVEDFVEFVNETDSKLYWHAYRLCGNRSQAQDLVQAAYLKLWKGWEPTYRTQIAAQFNNSKHPAYQAVTHAYFDQLRPKKNHMEQSDLTGHDVQWDHLVDEDVIASENRRQVLAAVRQLPDVFRELIISVYFYDTTIATFAESWGLTPRRASRYHQTALRQLEQLLEGHV